MADKAEEVGKLVEPYNPTDPIVVMDPEIDKSSIIRPYSATDTSDEISIDHNEYGAQTKFDAIVVPLVKINQTLLSDDQLKAVEIKISKFLPELYLKINDVNESIAKLNSPGMTSTVTVIITAPIEEVSKKISLDFYVIESVSNPDGTLDIRGELSLPGMNQVKNEQIGDDKLTTYGFLKKIAEETKLGFAATEKCESIDDSRWRQIYSQTFKDYIEDQISFGGLDEDSVFDAWIDQFGYLVMVNLSYVMSEEIDKNQLMMRVVKGVLMNEKKDLSTEQQYEEVIRLLTNSKSITGLNNFQFNRWSSETNNDIIMNEGTANKYYYMTAACDENLIQSDGLEIYEMSTDGLENKDTYKFDKVEFIGFEMDDDEPILMQKKKVSRFKAMMDYKKVYIEMNQPNYYLQRGTLVNLEFEDYDSMTKNTAFYNAENTMSAQTSDDIAAEEIDYGEQSQDVKDAMLNEHAGVPNFALSGMYYISDMEFKYDREIGEIVQCMHLVKRGLRNNIINKSMSIHI